MTMIFRNRVTVAVIAILLAVLRPLTAFGQTLQDSLELHYPLLDSGKSGSGKIEFPRHIIENPAYRLEQDLNSIPYHKESLLSKSMPAIVLLGAGCLYNDYLIDKHINHAGYMASPSFDIANWMQYAPAAVMLGTMGGLKLLGVKEYSDWPRVITMGAIATATQAAMVNGLKYTVKRPRPNQTQSNSFPSGHTATSFMTATMLHRELGQTMSPWFSVAGYTMATLVGISRNVANRHWISDVAAGAGIGIFSTEFAYSMTDLIYGDKHLTRLDRPTSDVPRWNFGLDTHYYFGTLKKYHGGEIPSELMPGYSIGMNASRHLTDHFSIELMADVTRIRWKGHDDMVLPIAGELPALFSIMGGMSFNVRPARNMELYMDCLAGCTRGHDYQLEDLDGNPVTAQYPRLSLTAQTRVGITIRTTRYSSITGYAGLEHYNDYAIMVLAGTSINLIF